MGKSQNVGIKSAFIPLIKVQLSLLGSTSK